MRSRTGCLACRERKIKCDEQKPVCRQCAISLRECIGTGIAFCHHHNPSMNESGSTDDLHFSKFYRYKNTFRNDAVWLEIPRINGFINTTKQDFDNQTAQFNVMVTEASTESCAISETQYLDLRESQSSNSVYKAKLPSRQINSRQSDVSTSYTPSPLGQPLSIEPSLSTTCRSCISTSQRPRLQITMKPARNTEQDAVFLLQWFSKNLACWMDFFNHGTFFASNVVIRAQHNRLLKCAAAACAAKALAGIQKREPLSRGCLKNKECQQIPHDGALVCWRDKAMSFYSEAMSLLIRTLEKHVATPNNQPYSWHSQYSSVTTDKNNFLTPGGQHSSSSAEEWLSIADALSSSVMLCLYEFLDVSLPEWTNHLKGARSLLRLLQNQIFSLQLPTAKLPQLLRNPEFSSEVYKMMFWNLANQDMLAVINESQTILDTEDIATWRQAGIHIDNKSILFPSNMTRSDRCGNDETETLFGPVYNTITWLMSRLVNYLATEKSSISNADQEKAVSSSGDISICWYNLEKHFDVWRDGLPVALDCGQTRFYQICLEVPICASAMQLYHMGKILLLLNKVNGLIGGFRKKTLWLDQHQHIRTACLQHSREIIRISRTLSDQAARIQSIQPLFTAGRCFSAYEEREAVLRLLHEIELDSGWVTQYRIQQLTDQWKNEGLDSIVIWTKVS